MDFHPTQVAGSGRGGDAEKEVWEALKNAIRTEDSGVAYYRYPLIDKAGDRFDKEPDILLLHEEVGLIVIEVKGYRIHHIDRIEGQTWHLQGTRQDYSTPYAQAREQAFFVRGWFDREPELRDDRGRCKIPVNFTVALPNITREEWEGEGLHETPSTPRVLTSDELSPQSFQAHLRNEPGDVEAVGLDEIEAASAVLSGSTVISGDRSPPPPDPTTKGELYEKLTKSLQRFDKTQASIGAEIPPGPQRIRGIAGSGKTLLIAKKAAHIHAKRPEADIVLTHFTKSLKDELQSLVEKFHYQMTESEPNWDKLQLMHGWGGEDVGDGVYYTIASQTDVEPKNAWSARNLVDGERDGPMNRLEAACHELVQEAEIPKIYDAILIDEGQDFAQWFYRMCYEALRENGQGQRQLIWAFDEAQTLADLGVATAKDVFGEDEAGAPRVDLSGSYRNGIQKSRIMRQSYRSPREVLLLAHAFGMGFQRRDGALEAAITNQEDWENIGYEVRGDFVDDDDATLTRPGEFSPHPLQHEADAKPAVRFEGVDNRESEWAYIAEQIGRDIQEQDLAPDDILVIPLGLPDLGREAGEELADRLEAEGIAANLTWKGDDEVFREDGKVTISRVHPAKGNEAAMVYLTHAEQVENDNHYAPLFARRNQAFVGITRARGWCTITGIEDDVVSEEITTLIDEIAGKQEVTFPSENMDGDAGTDASQRDLADFGLNH